MAEKNTEKTLETSEKSTETTTKAKLRSLRLLKLKTYCLESSS